MNAWIKGAFWSAILLAMSCDRAELMPLPTPDAGLVDMMLPACMCEPVSGPGCPRPDDPTAPDCLRRQGLERSDAQLQAADCFESCQETNKAAAYRCLSAFTKDAYACWVEESEFLIMCTQEHLYSECRLQSARLFQCGDTDRFDACAALAMD